MAPEKPLPSLMLSPVKLGAHGIGLRGKGEPCETLVHGTSQYQLSGDLVFLLPGLSMSHQGWSGAFRVCLDGQEVALAWGKALVRYQLTSPGTATSEGESSVSTPEQQEERPPGVMG